MVLCPVRLNAFSCVCVATSLPTRYLVFLTKCPHLVCDAGGGEDNSQDGDTALKCAAYGGRADCVRLLIGLGANKDVKGYVRR